MPTNARIVKAMVFSSSHIWTWELDHKEGWALKNWCFRTVVLEKILESPLDRKEIKPVNPKGNQPWIFTGRTNTEAEAQYFLTTWFEEPTHWKRPWCWERLKVGGEETNRGRMVGWHCWLNEHAFVNMSKLWEGMKYREAWHDAVPWVMSQSRTRLSGWMTISHLALVYPSFFPCNNAQEKGCCED